ncbi:ammonium transporter [Spirulina sp. 06S082]|uniref:ammonium transporter n=1 Tax=Spirulina sp. 06S082 TaxID=3110248 RepID=UPI002B1EBACB|nr:ammonium transporter [Spirulina sp. 06S082]MEA5470152.1 ammonium transporter [Spirulina sp. 06S082]
MTPNFLNNPSQKTRNWRSRSFFFCLSLAVVILLVGVEKAVAQSNVNPETLEFYINTIWLLIAASLVFFMNAGFAMLEAGLCRTSNATNVLAKNLIVFCVSALAFWLIGFGLMFGDGFGYDCTQEITETVPSFLGSQGFVFNLIFPADSTSTAFPQDGFSCLQKTWSNHSFSAVFFFQLVFAGTAATIVSGAVAERVRFYAFILFSFFLVGFIYPLTGHWVWGYHGLLQTLRFRDFAGSTVVHSVGGMAGLVGAFMLRPRNGKFGYNAENQQFEQNQTENNETEEFTPHNLSLATLGCIILWLGWFGFNGGSTTNLAYVAHIITTTMIAAASGGVAAIIFCPSIVGKPSLSSIINGVLGGLVSITASSAYMDMIRASIIGAIGGVIILFGEVILEKMKIDDPVGTIPVHLFCGGWGTIAVGIFSIPNSKLYFDKANKILIYDNRLIQTLCQFAGWLFVCAVAGFLSYIVWVAIGFILHWIELIFDLINPDKKPKIIGEFDNLSDFLFNQYKFGRLGIRVSPDEEKKGSDGVFYNPIVESQLEKRVARLEKPIDSE